MRNFVFAKLKAMRRHYKIVLYLCAFVVFLSLYVLQFTLSVHDYVEKNVATYRVLKENDESAPFDMNDLPPDDPTTLIDLTGFRFLLNNFPCNKTSPFALVLIHSAPDHIVNRNTIRNTWGTREVLLIFFLGKVDSEELQTSIQLENELYNDMVQGNFFDSYRNLTYKHVMALKWMLNFCPDAKYVIKSDDDVFINTPYLLEYLTTELSPYGARRLILCPRCLNCHPQRSHRSKWRVSHREYPYSSFPPYCFGWAVIYSPDVVFQLYEEAQRHRYFWIDDVHITGVLASKRNLTQIDLGSLVLSDEQFNDFMEGRAAFGLDTFLFGPPNLSTDDIAELWKFYESNTRLY